VPEPGEPDQLDHGRRETAGAQRGQQRSRLGGPTREGAGPHPEAA
jgi:hypothetical protein